jgi:hypothetical protein
MTELIELWMLAAAFWAVGFVCAGVLIDSRRDEE